MASSTIMLEEPNYISALMPQALKDAQKIQALGSPITSIKLPDPSIYKLEPFIVQLRLRISYLEEHQIFGVFFHNVR
jgi:hypothetical protein